MATAAQRRRRRIRLNRRAHSQGLTRTGFDYVQAGGERTLAERTTTSLRSQAEREMAEAYKPVNEGYSRRRGQIEALDAKRAADEQAFNQWSQQQRAALLSAAEARDAQLLALSAQQQKDLGGRLDEIRAARPNVSGGPGDTSVQDAAAAASTQQSAAAGQGMLARLGLGANLRTATAANSLNYERAISAKRQSETFEMLRDLADDEDKVAIDRASNRAKRIADLLGNEQEKTQLRIAAQQFGTKEANDLAVAQQAAEDRAAGRATSERGQDITRQNALDRIAAKGTEVNKYGYSNDEWKAMPRKRRQRIIRRFGKGEGAKKGTVTEGQRSNYVGVVQNYATGLRDQLGPFKKSLIGDDAAHETLTTIVEHAQGKGQRAQLQAAYDLWRYGKLRPGSRKKLRQAGIRIPKGW